MKVVMKLMIPTQHLIIASMKVLLTSLAQTTQRVIQPKLLQIRLLIKTIARFPIKSIIPILLKIIRFLIILSSL